MLQKRELKERLSGGRQPLPPDTFAADQVLALAPFLLGKILVTEKDGLRTSGIIVETEAYRAPDDRACHAWNNRRTARTEVMFARGGHAYVYLCYGIHHLFNVVTGPQDHAQAVLIRALEPLEGIDTMLRRRGMHKIEYRLTAGPGVLSQALGITTKKTGQLLRPDSGVWIESDPGLRILAEEIRTGPRIGVEGAGASASLPWRFHLGDNPWASKG